MWYEWTGDAEVTRSWLVPEGRTWRAGSWQHDGRRRWEHIFLSEMVRKSSWKVEVLKLWRQSASFSVESVSLMSLIHFSIFTKTSPLDIVSLHRVLGKLQNCPSAGWDLRKVAEILQKLVYWEHSLNVRIFNFRRMNPGRSLAVES